MLQWRNTIRASQVYNHSTSLPLSYSDGFTIAMR